jgi:putative phosphoribosyl transferase
VSTRAAAASVQVEVPTSGVVLEGDLAFPDSPVGVVLFAHGSGSSRKSARNRFVAETLNRAAIATLLIDLLTSAEEEIDRYTREHRFDIDLLWRRLVGALDWLRNSRGADLPVGLFGASTGAAAALIAAAERPNDVAAVVSRGGRPDLAGPALERVHAPTLFIVGERDDVVLELNERASVMLAGVKELTVVPGASHLFEEPGALELVAQLAADWFRQHFTGVVHAG